MIGKRLAALGLAGVFALTLAACGSSTTAGSSSSSSSAAASSSDAMTSSGAMTSSAAMSSSGAMTSGATGAGLVGPGCAAYAAANASGPASVDGMAAASVAEAASANPLLKTLVAAVTGKLNPKVNLAKTLDSSEFTVFAPVDSAFAKLPAATVATLKTDDALLSKILTYHVIAGQLDPSQIVGTHKTVEGGTVTVTGSGDNLKVDKASVICGGVKTKNATVYLIDTVLTPTS